MMRSLEFWTSRFPFILVVGGGLNQLQPVSADDVATCVVQSLYNRETVGKTFDLPGPDRIMLTELLQTVCVEVTGRSKPVIKLPANVALAIADMMGRLNPQSQMSDETMRLLSADMTADPALVMDTFQVQLLPFESQYRRITTSRG